MTATNHALTGAIIGATIANPWVALVVAFLSHFVLDVIPHYGQLDSDAYVQTNSFARLLIADTTLCGLLVIALAIGQPHLWWFVAICAFVATTPDFASINRWLHARRGQLKHWKPGLFIRFAAKIQWFERPIGAAVEAVWFTSAVIILVSVLRARG